MTSSQLAALGAIIGMVLLLWWLASLSDRLAQIEKTLTLVQGEQQHMQTALAHEKSMEDLRSRLDLLESRLISEVGGIADQTDSHTDRLITQFSVLESRMDALQDQLGIIESLLESDEAGQTASENEVTGRQP